MNEPKRWSSPSSEVDPVLRSVLLYARDLQPDSQQLQAILRGSGRRHPTPKRRRFMAIVIASAAAAFAGVAWAGYASGLLFSSPPNPPSAPTAPSVTSAPARRTPPRSAPRPVAGGSLDVAPHDALDVAPHDALDAPPRVDGQPPRVGGQPSRVDGQPSRVDGQPSRVDGQPSRVDSSAPPVASSAARATPPALPEQDAALLQQARLLVTTDPARALTLTRDHELHFPASALTEERQALRVEALARLGRRAEAAHALSAFDERYPRSIYRHRLHALLPD